MRQLVLLSLLSWSCLIGWIAAAETAFADGRLGRARREVEGDDRPHKPSPPRQSETRASSVRSYEPRPPERTHWHAAEPVYAYPGCGPSCASLAVAPDEGMYVDEPVSIPAYPQPTYASYPYASPHGPYMLEPDLQLWAAASGYPTPAAGPQDPAVGQPWAGRFSVDAGYLLGIMHGNLGARLLTPSRFEFAVRGALMYEPSVRDRAQLLTLELGVRLLQLDPLMVRLFAAAQNFEQAGLNQYGGEFGIDADLFVGRPWVLSLRASGAVLGEAFVSTLRVQLGYLFERYEVFVAYQDLRIGEVNLSAPLIGTRVWL